MLCVLKLDIRVFKEGELWQPNINDLGSGQLAPK